MRKSVRSLACALGVTCLLALSTTARAEQKLKSPDGQIELTVKDDGTIQGKNTKTNKTWTFPPRNVEKAKNHKTAFAPKGSVGAKGDQTIFVAYGGKLYNLSSDGKFRWTYELGNDADDKVTFTFVKDTVVLTVGDKKSAHDMRTGQKLKPGK